MSNKVGLSTVHVEKQYSETGCMSTSSGAARGKIKKKGHNTHRRKTDRQRGDTVREEEDKDAGNNVQD